MPIRRLFCLVERRGSSAQPRAARLHDVAAALGRDTAGATAIEFAIVAAPFLGLVLLILQVALYHFSLQSLDYATRVSARQIMTGEIGAGAKTLSGFKTTLLCPNVMWGIDCDKVIVNAYKIGKINDKKNGTGIYQFVKAQTKALAAVQTDSKQQSFCLGGPGDYVFLDVAYPYPNFVGSLLSAGRDGPEDFQLRSTSFIFNEPFASAGGASC